MRKCVRCCELWEVPIADSNGVKFFNTRDKWNNCFLYESSIAFHKVKTAMYWFPRTDLCQKHCTCNKLVKQEIEWALKFLINFQSDQYQSSQKRNLNQFLNSQIVFANSCHRWSVLCFEALLWLFCLYTGLGWSTPTWLITQRGKRSVIAG